MTLHIDRDTAISLLVRAVDREDRGVDHVDKACQNVVVKTDEWDNQVFIPSCIVGTALALGGVPAKTLYDAGGSLLFSTGPVLARNGDVSFTADAAFALAKAQATQDDKRTWGDALIAAIGANLDSAPVDDPHADAARSVAAIPTPTPSYVW